MKKNLYKYAALAIIVEKLAAEADTMRRDAENTRSYYEPESVPEYAKEEIVRKLAIADEIDAFWQKI